MKWLQRSGRSAPFRAPSVAAAWNGGFPWRCISTALKSCLRRRVVCDEDTASSHPSGGCGRLRSQLPPVDQRLARIPAQGCCVRRYRPDVVRMGARWCRSLPSASLAERQSTVSAYSRKVDVVAGRTRWPSVLELQSFARGPACSREMECTGNGAFGEPAAPRKMAAGCAASRAERGHIARKRTTLAECSEHVARSHRNALYVR